MDEVRQWQACPLEPLYPIVYVDCLVVHVRENQQVLNKSLYLVLAVDLHGHKELLGMWIAQTEGAKFWLQVLTRTAEPWGEGHFHRVRGWTHRLTQKRLDRSIPRRGYNGA